MKIKFLLTLFLLLTAASIVANVAQPGIWNAGGMGNFSLLFPDDSLAYKKIQMTDEKVSIQLYKGYAVVKGVYKMYNDTKDIVKIKTGYPLNVNFKSNANDIHRADIRFDSLYGLDVMINSVPVKIISEPSETVSENSQNDNWYVWQNTFAPEDTTVITVYFIVNTNNNFVRKGYSKDKFNGFIYILETGSTWKQPIINGEIRIKLEDEIKLDDIKGIKPDSVFKFNFNNNKDENNNLLQYKFKSITPSYSDNIIITYAENAEDFNFAEILSKKDFLYKSIDDFSELKINSAGLKGKKFKSPYEVESSGWESLSIFLISFFVIIIIIFVAVLVFIVKRIRRKV